MYAAPLLRLHFGFRLASQLNYQNEYFSASCISLGGAAFTTWPKSELSTSPFTAVGPKNCVWLKTLNDSKRNCNVFVSRDLEIPLQHQVRVEHPGPGKVSPRHVTDGAYGIVGEGAGIEILQLPLLCGFVMSRGCPVKSGRSR